MKIQIRSHSKVNRNVIYWNIFSLSLFISLSVTLCLSCHLPTGPKSLSFLLSAIGYYSVESLSLQIWYLRACSKIEAWRFLTNLLDIRRIIVEIFTFPKASFACCTWQAFALWDHSMESRWWSTALGREGWFPNKRGFILPCISLVYCRHFPLVLLFYFFLGQHIWSWLQPHGILLIDQH